jgi:transcriptional regulator with XRE-family HTH domain
MIANSSRAEFSELTPVMIDDLLEGESPLRVWRRCRGMTVQTLAEKVGVRPKKILAIESGHGSLKGILLHRVALALNVDPSAVRTHRWSVETYTTLYPTEHHCLPRISHLVTHRPL